MNNLTKELKRICTYHSDDGTSGYLLSEEQFEAIRSLLTKTIKEAKPKEAKINEDEDCMSVSNLRAESYNWGINDFEAALLGIVEKGGGK